MSFVTKSMEVWEFRCELELEYIEEPLLSSICCAASTLCARSLSTTLVVVGVGEWRGKMRSATIRLSVLCGIY